MLDSYFDSFAEIRVSNSEHQTEANIKIMKNYKMIFSNRIKYIKSEL